MKIFGLYGKRILVTGADGFLGFYIRKALEEEGSVVHPIDLKDSPTAHGVDISNPDAVEDFVADLAIAETKIDGIINNAAVGFKGNKLTQDQFLKTINTNIYGTYNCITLFKPILAENASIVNLSSIYGKLSPDFSLYDGDEHLFNASAYGASKAAIEQLTRYYAVQFAPIRVNSISPGGILQPGHNDAFSEKYAKRIPLKRMANPEEIINAILFLLSPLSSYITGHDLIVDGGLSAW